jgi:hypothetical protein
VVESASLAYLRRSLIMYVIHTVLLIRLFEFKRYVDIGREGSISGAMSKMTSQVSQDRGKYHLGEVQESPCQEPTVPKMAYSPCAENSATCLGAEGNFASDSTSIDEDNKSERTERST